MPNQIVEKDMHYAGFCGVFQKKTQANIGKKLKQIILKLNNLPTKTNFFSKSSEFNGFCQKMFAQT